MPPSRYSTKARRTNPTKTTTTIVGSLICLPSGSLLQCARLDEHHIGREVLRQASLWWPRSQKTQKRELSLSGPRSAPGRCNFYRDRGKGASTELLVFP